MGSLSPIIYFENSAGDISLPPTTEDALRLKSEMSGRGYNLCEAGTLSEVDRLQKRLQEQELNARHAELERDEVSRGVIRAGVRQRLLDRLVSSSTGEYEKEFIKAYLMLREEKREHWRRRFLGDVCYLTVREFDSAHAKHRIRDTLSAVPDADKPCARCGKFRPVQGSKYCFKCNYGD
jgi:hypothetical protein